MAKAAAALAADWASEPAQTAAARLAVVQHVTAVGLLPLDPDGTLHEVLERVRTGLSATTAAVMLLADGADEPVPRAAVGELASLTLGSLPPVDRQLAARVATAREPLVVVDARDQDGPMLGDRLLSAVAVPLTAAGTVLGVLQVSSTTPSAFDNDDVALLGVLADRVALAVARAHDAERELAAQAALRVSEQRARAVLETAVDGIITFDRHGIVESVNPAAERHPRTGDRPLIGIGREVVGQRADGSTFPAELAVSEVGSDTDLLTGVVRDISERKQFESQLAQQALQALHDPLTGLANRTLLLEHIQAALDRLGRHGGLVALLFLDLDRFKLVNDTLGHEAGDELLVQAAALLRGCVREQDVVARLGGDEFVVLCTDLDGPQDVEVVASRVSHAINVPVLLRGREVSLSASVGVVSAGVRGTAAELLRDADAAMYQAKEQGSGRYAVLDADARAGRSERLRLAADLPGVLERNELLACYQPLVDLHSGEVVAAEALLRWRHPERGELAPAAFIGLAAEVGAIGGFDDWMLRTACRDSACWTRLLGRPIGVWVNVSGQSLADPRLPATVAATLADCGLDPALLTLEITEGALMRDAATTVTTLLALRELGVQLAVDDFGTGYSSLAYLQRFPVHALKVDRSFVGRLDGSADQADGSGTIVKAVVNLAAGLGLRTVAEGIETPGQLAAATALGCTLGQGYFLGRPATAADILVAVAHGVLLPLALTRTDVTGRTVPDGDTGPAGGRQATLTRARYVGEPATPLGS